MNICKITIILVLISILTACNTIVENKEIPLSDINQIEPFLVSDIEPLILDDVKTNKESLKLNDKIKMLNINLPEHIYNGDLFIENAVLLSELEELNFLLFTAELPSLCGADDENERASNNDHPSTFLVSKKTNTINEASVYFLELDKVVKKITPKTIYCISIDGKRFACMSFKIDHSDWQSKNEMELEIFEGSNSIGCFRDEYVDLLLSPDLSYYTYSLYSITRKTRNFTYSLYKSINQEEMFSSTFLDTNMIFSDNNKYFLNKNNHYDGFINIYSMIDNSLYEKIYFEESITVKQMTANDEILYTSGINTYLTVNNRAESLLIGQYVFDPLLSPDGKYLAYTFCPVIDYGSYVKYNIWPTPIDDENAEILSRIIKMQKGIYILELFSGKTAFLPLAIDEGHGGIGIISWAVQDSIDQFIKDNQ